MSNVFDELALEKEIYEKWGPHGAHADVYRMLLKKCNERAAGWNLLEQVNQYLGNLQDSLEGTPYATAVADTVGDIRRAITKLAETRPAFKRYYAFNGNINDRESRFNPICYPRGGMRGLNRLLAALNGAD